MTIMNAAAFRRDLIEMQSDLQRFAFKLTADKEEANDLLQETSLRALENMEKYTPDTNFKGWMYTMMRNNIVFFEQTLRKHCANTMLGFARFCSVLRGF